MAIQQVGAMQPAVQLPQPPFAFSMPSQVPFHSPCWFMPPPPPPGKPQQKAQGFLRRPKDGKKRKSNLGRGNSGHINIKLLKAENRRKTRRHLQGFTAPAVPHAPQHSGSVLIHVPGSDLTSPLGYSLPSGFHAMTPNPFRPGTAWKNGLGTVDQAAADLSKIMGIDIYGSNAGLLGVNSEPESDGDADATDLNDPFGFNLELGGYERTAHVPASARTQIDEQQAYIAQLEEQNMNLQDRLFIAEQQLQELQARAVRANLPTSSSDESYRSPSPTSPVQVQNQEAMSAEEQGSMVCW
eukprot:gene17578-23903_t